MVRIEYLNPWGTQRVKEFPALLEALEWVVANDIEESMILSPEYAEWQETDKLIREFRKMFEMV